MNTFFNNLSNRMGTIAQNGLNGLSAGENAIGRTLSNGVSAVGNLFPRPKPQIVNSAPTPTPAVQPQAPKTLSPYIPIGAQYQRHLQQVQNAENNIGSFKKGGEVKKTGNYKLHKGEFVVNPRLAALIKSGQGEKLKGYKQTHKTIPKLKYDREKSLAYREKTGYFKTKINGGGHDAGYKWAEKKEIDPKDRKRKYGANSPSFDEGVHEYKQKALKNMINRK